MTDEKPPKPIDWAKTPWPPGVRDTTPKSNKMDPPFPDDGLMPKRVSRDELIGKYVSLPELGVEGVVEQCWHGADALARRGRWHLRVRLENGPIVSVTVDELPEPA